MYWTGQYSAQARTISKIKHALLKLATHSSAVNQYVLLGGTEGLEMSMSDEIQVISVDDHRLMVDEMKARYMSSKGAIADEDGDDENAHVFRQAIIWDDYNAEEDDYSPPAASGPFIAPTGLLLYDPCAEKYTAGTPAARHPTATAWYSLHRIILCCRLFESSRCPTGITYSKLANCLG